MNRTGYIKHEIYVIPKTITNCVLISIRKEIYGRYWNHEVDSWEILEYHKISISKQWEKLTYKSDHQEKIDIQCISNLLISRKTLNGLNYKTTKILIFTY